MTWLSLFGWKLQELHLRKQELLNQETKQIDKQAEKQRETPLILSHFLIEGL